VRVLVAALETLELFFYRRQGALRALPRFL
jgi:hypothetical protein